MRIQGLLAAGLMALAQGAAAAPVEELRVVFVRDGVFTSPTDKAWAAIPESSYDLQEQLIAPPVGGGSVSKVSVRATHDGEEVTVRLTWADPSADRGVGVNTFRDAAAIGFPAGRPEVAPAPFMGDPEHPVVIWQWAADFDANAEGDSRFGERYPHAEGVWIFPQDLSVRRKVRGWRGADPVIEYIARGFGTLTPRMGASVEGISDYRDGRWTVVLRRQLTTSNPTDAAFVPGEETSFILAIWNGEQEEVNGRKAVTYNWIPAKLDGLGSTTAKSDVGASRAGD
ncbi:MAG: ethylbenzene dehydrogenase-related protein [Myxococcota bacterium]